MIVAPTFSFHDRAWSSSNPVSPPSRAGISLNARVANAHSWSAMPPSPIGFSRLWLGPAT